MRLVTIHGISPTPKSYAYTLTHRLRAKDHRIVYWEAIDLTPAWFDKYIPWLDYGVDLFMAISRIFRGRRHRIFRQIQEAVGDGVGVVVVAHSHGVWLATEALAHSPPVAHLVLMGRSIRSPFLFRSRRKIRAHRTTNFWSAEDPLSAPLPSGLTNLGSRSDIELRCHHRDYWTNWKVARTLQPDFMAMPRDDEDGFGYGI